MPHILAGGIREPQKSTWRNIRNEGSKESNETGSDPRKLLEVTQGRRKPEPFLLTLTPPIWAALHTPLPACLLGSPLISMVTLTVSSQQAWTTRLNRNYLKALETYLEGKQKWTTPSVFTQYLKQLPIAFPGGVGDRIALQARVHSWCLSHTCLL